MDIKIAEIARRRVQPAHHKGTVQMTYQNPMSSPIQPRASVALTSISKHHIAPLHLHRGTPNAEDICGAAMLVLESFVRIKLIHRTYAGR